MSLTTTTPNKGTHSIFLPQWAKRGLKFLHKTPSSLSHHRLSCEVNFPLLCLTIDCWVSGILIIELSITPPSREFRGLVVEPLVLETHTLSSTGLESKEGVRVPGKRKPQKWCLPLPSKREAERCLHVITDTMQRLCSFCDSSPTKPVSAISELPSCGLFHESD